MKSLSQHIDEKLIDEKLIINKNLKTRNYKYFPKDKAELRAAIKEHCDKGIYNLNDIDTSEVEDFSNLFYNDFYKVEKTKMHSYDVSKWDVSNGKDFSCMFTFCKKFNCDISKWDVSRGEKFYSMFEECENFNCDLSKWNVSRGVNFCYMFANCTKFNSDLSGWDVYNGDNFSYMFKGCINFNSDLSNWDVRKKRFSKSEMVANSGLTKENYPSWLKRKKLF